MNLLNPLNRQMVAATLILCMAVQGAIAPGGTKAKPKAAPEASRFSSDLYQKRGEDLDNFIYEVFDPNAKPATKEKSTDTPASGMHNPVRWWWVAGAAGLVGTGVAGYFLMTSGPTKIKVVNLNYTDSTGAGP